MAKSFQFKDLPDLLKKSFQKWNADDPWRLSAVVAYYAILSLPPLLVIVVTVAGFIWGEEAVQGMISQQVGEAIGQEAARQVEDMIRRASQNEQKGWALVISIGTLIFGATGVFYQLQKSLNEIWEVKAKPDAGIGKMLKDRLFGFGMIIVIAFLLLISLVLTAALSALSNWITSILPEWTIYLFYVLNFLVSIGIITLLFAAVYKVLPDVEIDWNTVWFGAFVTALLFVLGKFLLGLYFGNADPASTYGAAGSVVLVLLWVSYSCLLLFFGAEFTQMYANKYGHEISPSDHAEWSAEYRLKHGQNVPRKGEPYQPGDEEPGLRVRGRV